MDIVKYISKEWRVLKSAPFSFLVLLTLGLAGGFGMGTKFMSQELATTKARLDLKNDEINGIKSGLEKRIEKVEDIISKQKIHIFMNEITKNPSNVKLSINKSYKEDINILNQINSAFKTSGWNTELNEFVGSYSDVVQINPEQKDSADTIEKALNDAKINHSVFTDEIGNTSFVIKENKVP